MSPIKFPDPKYANALGIVVIGVALDADNLLSAYRQGIFPWPIEGCQLPWFCPPVRAIIEFGELHLPRSLRQAQRRAPFRFTIDAAFGQVIRACAASVRMGETGTWITPGMIRAYCELHQLGHAHSIEAWEGNELVGGLYGVDAGGVFTGESMFFRRSNASKLALLHLIEHLRERGLGWLDIQMMTPHMLALGAREIPRRAFLEKLAREQARGLKLFG